MENQQNTATFYDIFNELCRLNGVKCTTALRELKISKSTYANWKMGGIPQKATIRKIEDRFKIESDTIVNIMAGIESPYSHDYYAENWRIMIRSLFPNAMPSPSEDIVVLSETELKSLKEKIESIKNTLKEIENIVYGKDTNDNKED